MNKKELFDALDDFSQQLLATLADVEAIKKNLKSVVEENTALRLENDKLRERLSDEEQKRLKNEASSGEYTIAYHRDFGEKFSPNDIITPEEQKEGEHKFVNVDYVYIQDKNGVWYVNRRDGDKYFNGVAFKKVTQEMVEG